VCDSGGWTDIWFSGHGKIFNIGVYPYVDVQIRVSPYTGDGERIVIYAENYGEQYTWQLKRDWDLHLLPEAAIERMGVPDDVTVRMTIHSEAPARASTGTSAPGRTVTVRRGGFSRVQSRCWHIADSIT